jgi:hypothetical protein
LFAIWTPLKSAAQDKRKFKGRKEMKMAVAKKEKAMRHGRQIQFLRPKNAAASCGGKYIRHTEGKAI